MLKLRYLAQYRNFRRSLAVEIRKAGSSPGSPLNRAREGVA